MLDHQAILRIQHRDRRIATVGAEAPPDDKPKATLGETLMVMIPPFLAGVLLVATLGLVREKT